MMEAVRTSETSVDNHFTRQYIPEDNSEDQTHTLSTVYAILPLLFHDIATRCSTFSQDCWTVFKSNYLQ
jgi:hypothetical protein